MHIKKVIFRHRDRYVIRKLLIEIGENTLNTECWSKKLNKPSNINLFYLETDEHFTYLKYKYPNLGERIIMKLDGYKLPETGWIRCVLK